MWWSCVPFDGFIAYKWFVKGLKMSCAMSHVEQLRVTTLCKVRDSFSII